MFADLSFTSELEDLMLADVAHLEEQHYRHFDMEILLSSVGPFPDDSADETEWTEFRARLESIKSELRLNEVKVYALWIRVLLEQGLSMDSIARRTSLSGVQILEILRAFPILGALHVDIWGGPDRQAFTFEGIDSELERELLQMI